jgi:hypothetical protein
MLTAFSEVFQPHPHGSLASPPGEGVRKKKERDTHTQIRQRERKSVKYFY